MLVFDLPADYSDCPNRFRCLHLHEHWCAQAILPEGRRRNVERAWTTNEVLGFRSARCKPIPYFDLHAYLTLFNIRIWLQLECCGIDSPLNWGLIIPKSCCAGETTVCTPLNSYQQGCKDGLRNFVESSGLKIGYIALIVAAIEVSIA